MNWLEALNRYKRINQSCVLVMITNVEGSAPRPVGTRMLVSAENYFDTLGGGALELEAISHARALLVNDTQNPAISARTLSLGGELSQCCGGRVTLQFDCHFANSFVLHVYGAGHVAQEVARIVQRLPCVTTFHDSRADWLVRLVRVLNPMAVETHDAVNYWAHGQIANASIATNQLALNAYAAVESCQPNACYIVMTHSHELDFEIVEAVLSRGDAAYCGLIASKSKATRFRNRLKRKGFTTSELCGLTAPLGQQVQTGNSPMEVAIAAISDVLTVRQRNLHTGGFVGKSQIIDSSEVES